MLYFLECYDKSTTGLVSQKCMHICSPNEAMLHTFHMGGEQLSKLLRRSFYIALIPYLPLLKLQ